MPRRCQSVEAAQSGSCSWGPTYRTFPGSRGAAKSKEGLVIALITQGKSNAEVAELTYLKPNTVKSYIRSTYRKIGASSRTQAVLWGVRHGFVPDHERLQQWNAHP